jgi:two-component system, LytTR family, sensor kinase
MNKPALRYKLSDRIAKMVSITLGSGVVGFLFYSYLHYSESGFFPSFTKERAQIIASVFNGAILGVALFFFNRNLNQWLPWRKYFTSRFIVGYTLDTLLSFVMTLGLATIMASLADSKSFWKVLDGDDEDLKWKIAILLITIMFIYNVIYALLYSYQHYAIAQIETLQNERRQLELQFEALKSQISPHYLFNSLNTISSLLFKDLPSAEQFIRRLAQTYQYILSTQSKKYVLLREEVDFVQSYYYLLRIRFQQQLSVEINLPSGIMDSPIPPLTLQMLVENAVKHNNLTSDKKLFIYITAQDNLYLKVINTKTNLLNAPESFQVGLENIRRRYQYFTDQKIEIRDEDKFTVSLPVIVHRQELAEQKFSA